MSQKQEQIDKADRQYRRERQAEKRAHAEEQLESFSREAINEVLADAAAMEAKIGTVLMEFVDCPQAA